MQLNGLNPAHANLGGNEQTDQSAKVAAGGEAASFAAEPSFTDAAAVEVRDQTGRWIPDVPSAVSQGWWEQSGRRVSSVAAFVSLCFPLMSSLTVTAPGDRVTSFAGFFVKKKQKSPPKESRF